MYKWRKLEYHPMKQKLILLYLTYLRYLAKLEFAKRPNMKIIGITGSSGKTTAKNAIAHILRTKHKVKEGYKANSQTGIPLDILGLHLKIFTKWDWLRVSILAPIKLLTNWKQYDYYVVEMGIDGPEEPVNMGYLLKIFKPDIGVFLNVSSSHAEPWDKLVPKSALDRLEKIISMIAREKGKILTELDSEATAIANEDDPHISPLLGDIAAKTISFGRSGDVSFEAVKSDIDGFEAIFKYEDQSAKLNIKNELFSKVYAYNFAAAIAVATSAGIDFEEAVAALSDFSGQPGRLKIIEGINSSTLIDSTYNSQPNSLQTSLEIVKNLKHNGRKVLVLGDMRELGESTEFWHRELAKQAVFADYIVLVGPAMEEFFKDELIIQKFTKEKIKHFENTYQAALYLNQSTQENDLAFLQASQNTLLFEIIAEELMANPEDAEKLLCRRGAFWGKKREEIREAGVKGLSAHSEN